MNKRLIATLIKSPYEAFYLPLFSYRRDHSMFIRLHSSDVSPIIKSDHACPDNSTHGIHFFTQYTTFFYYGYSSRGHGNLRSFKDHQGFRIMVYDAGSGIMGGINGTNIQSRGVRRISICDVPLRQPCPFQHPRILHHYLCNYTKL